MTMHALLQTPRQLLQQLLRASPTRSAFHTLRNQRTIFRNDIVSKTIQSRSIHSIRRNVTNSRINHLNRSRIGQRRFASTAAEGESLSLSQRLKKLSREYGWSAVGVYLFLSAADFPFCFLAVRTLGTDRIGHWEHIAVTKIKEFVTWPLGKQTQEVIDGAVEEVEDVVMKKVPVQTTKVDGEGRRILEEEDTYIVADHGYKEAEKANRGSNASLWTQLALAYAIHKSFIFIRVPLTAAVTPKVVKTLRSWGWNIGKRPTKTVASSSGNGASASVNTKGSGVKSD